MHPCVETMMGLFGGPNLLNEGHFNPVPGMLLVEKRRRARAEMHERIGMQMQVNLSSLADFVSTRKVNHCQPL